MRPTIRAITVCVHYDDILKITLPSLLPHVDEVVVITSPTDKETLEYLEGYDRVRPFVTDAFYRNNAKFNKGLALEEGFDFLGRKGWIVVLDADIVLPPDAGWWFEHGSLEVGKLYTPTRRILENVSAWHKWSYPDKWSLLPTRKDDRGHYGYFQLFHATDSALSKKPWYNTNWTHAGRADDEFQHRWSKECKARPGFEVLHLGKCDENWFGRSTERLDGKPVDPKLAKARRDMQTRLRKKHGWGHKKSGDNFEERVIPEDKPRPRGKK